MGDDAAAAGGGQQQRVGNHVEGASSRDDGGRVDASKDAVHPSWAASAKAKQQLAAKPAGDPLAVSLYLCKEVNGV